MYHLVILKLKAIRALWIDAVRILPIQCMGEKDTVLLLGNSSILTNIVLNKNLNLDVNDENRLNYKGKIEERLFLKINRG
jgi:hypothetical protein